MELEAKNLNIDFETVNNFQVSKRVINRMSVSIQLTINNTLNYTQHSKL
jgi:hypothetical protein